MNPDYDKIMKIKEWHEQGLTEEEIWEKFLDLKPDNMSVAMTVYIRGYANRAWDELKRRKAPVEIMASVMMDFAPITQMMGLVHLINRGIDEQTKNKLKNSFPRFSGFIDVITQSNNSTNKKTRAEQVKQITKNCFRTLKNNECRVLLMRHHAHKRDMVSVQTMQWMAEYGQKCAGADITIAASLSSPANRCLAAIMGFNAGCRASGHTRTDDRLANLPLHHRKVITALKAEAEKRGEHVNHWAFLKCLEDEPHQRFMEQRGQEAGQAIREFAGQHDGETALVSSHTASRMEMAVGYLRGEPFDEFLNQYFAGRVHMMQLGQIVELVIDTKTGALLEEHYLEPPRQS